MIILGGGESGVSVFCKLLVQVTSFLLFSERHPSSVLITELNTSSWVFCGIHYYGITLWQTSINLSRICLVRKVFFLQKSNWNTRRSTKAESFKCLSDYVYLIGLVSNTKCLLFLAPSSLYVGDGFFTFSKWYHLNIRYSLQLLMGWKHNYSILFTGNMPCELRADSLLQTKTLWLQPFLISPILILPAVWSVCFTTLACILSHMYGEV